MEPRNVRDMRGVDIKACLLILHRQSSKVENAVAYAKSFPKETLTH